MLVILWVDMRCTSWGMGRAYLPGELPVKEEFELNIQQEEIKFPATEE